MANKKKTDIPFSIFALYHEKKIFFFPLNEEVAEEEKETFSFHRLIFLLKFNFFFFSNRFPHGQKTCILRKVC
jgi:hypothetical protein